MALIDFKHVSVEFPVYNTTGRSLKQRLINLTTGGKLKEATPGVVIVQALNNLSFSIHDGEKVALLGHNGAGKTTLLRTLSKVYAPTAGKVTIEGRLGSLIDISLGIDPDATGLENIYLRGRLLGMSREEIKARTPEIINYCELGDFVTLPVRTYSSGMQMRLAFTISTAVRPEILLMDEWLSVGDESFRHKAETRMNEVLETTSILVVATHSRELVLHTCTRAIWLEQGRIRMDGPAQTVCDSYFGH